MVIYNKLIYVCYLLMNIIFVLRCIYIKYIVIVMRHVLQSVFNNICHIKLYYILMHKYII